MASNVNVTIEGPLFDGEATAAVKEWLASTRKDLGVQAQAIVKAKAMKMNRSGRGGSGRAADAVQLVPGAAYVNVVGVSTKGEVWWPWLEGTSHRNQSTRFKGYHAFRLARGIVAKRARTTAQAALEEYIAQMGGGG
jgi:hypothetical protein